jgi:hypothetical protein
MTEGHIVHLAMDAYADYLLEKLKTDIPTSDPSRSMLVRAGRLQEDPTRQSAENYVLVQENDPEVENWVHQLNSTVDTPPAGSDFTFEMPGASLFWRRISLEVGGYYIVQQYDRETASRHFHRFAGRAAYYAQHAAVDRTAGILGLRDEFNETIIGIYVEKERFNESGGPPKSFIWRGRINIALRTHRDW